MQVSLENTRACFGKRGKWQKSILRWAAAEGAKEQDGLLFSLRICTVFFCIFLLKPKTSVIFSHKILSVASINFCYHKCFPALHAPADPRAVEGGGRQGQDEPQDSAASPNSLGQVLDK